MSAKQHQQKTGKVSHENRLHGKFKEQPRHEGNERCVSQRGNQQIGREKEEKPHKVTRTVMSQCFHQQTTECSASEGP